MKHQFVAAASALVFTFAAVAAHGQTVGLTDQNFSSVNVTPDYVLSQDEHYTPYWYVDGNSTLSHSYDSGTRTYNTATGQTAYSDEVQFGSFLINASTAYTSGYNADTGVSSHLQDLYGGSSTDYQGSEYPGYNAAFRDTFTALTAMTLNFRVKYDLDLTLVQSPEGSASYYADTHMYGDINGSNSQAADNTLFGDGVTFNNLSFTLNAGDTVNFELGAYVGQYGGTYYAQSVQTNTVASSLAASLQAWSSDGQFTTGSAHVYAVPEPAELAPLAIAALGLLYRRGKH